MIEGGRCCGRPGSDGVITVDVIVLGWRGHRCCHPGGRVVIVIVLAWRVVTAIVLVVMG